MKPLLLLFFCILFSYAEPIKQQSSKELNRFFTISEDDRYRRTETTLLLASINAKNIDIARELIRSDATNEIERVFEFAYANNIAINHKEILFDKKTTSEVKKLAMIYINDNEK